MLSDYYLIYTEIGGWYKIDVIFDRLVIIGYNSVNLGSFNCVKYLSWVLPLTLCDKQLLSIESR